MTRLRGLALTTLLLSGCGAGDEEKAERSSPAAAPAAAEAPDGVTLLGDGRERLSPEELERGRFDAGWKQVVQLDTAVAVDTARSREKWEDISAEAVNGRPTSLPLYGNVAGPSVLSAQILLDRALFSPGVMDGRWGANTEKALYWFQRREGLPATGRVDRQTFERLRQVAGNPTELVRNHTLSEEDVAGPFVEMPEDIYERAKLECMCYETLGEKLAERFHTTTELLARLNPGVSLDSLSAGTRIQVPNVRDSGAQAGQVAKLVISDQGRYLHALDASGRILYHFPTTLGASYAPSPSGDYRITSITKDPWWHYQPKILETVPDEEEDARIPPGPNNAVGLVWMALSKPHYGIHGTSAPETIGYAVSHGCVRLTNWDALFLADKVRKDTPVEFRDVARG